MRKIEIQEIKRLEIEILDFVVEVCNTKNLKYFLSYGTLLGAIRHKGFIPWDDDIDICMPREDYNVLLEYLRTLKSSKFKVLISHVDNYYYPFAKVINTDTIVPIREIEELHELGVWIDIFPLDGIPTTHEKIYRFLMDSLSHIRHLAVFKKLPQLSLKKLIIIWPCWKFSRLIGLFNMLKWTEILATKKSYKEVKKVGVVVEPDSGAYFDKQMFENLILAEFEHKKYNVPADYDTYLKSIYGNYMQFPPVEKRIAHGIVAYMK